MRVAGRGSRVKGLVLRDKRLVFGYMSEASGLQIKRA
jgi:hypothetical protein